MVEAVFSLEHLAVGIKDASYEGCFDPACRSSQPGNLCAVFEGRADQSLLLCAAANAAKAGAHYELCIGAEGNTSVWLRRNGREVARAPARLCRGDAHVQYWVTVSGGKFCFGTGWEMGRGTVLTFQDPSPLPVDFFGFSSGRRPADYRSITVGYIEDPIAFNPENPKLAFATLDGDGAGAGASGGASAAEEGGGDGGGADDGAGGAVIRSTADEDAEALRHYQEVCRKAKERADRFGVPYVPPAPSKALPWSVAKRLQQNITGNAMPSAAGQPGFDTESAEAKEKMAARADRFGMDTEPVKAAAEADEASALMQKRRERFGLERDLKPPMARLGLKVAQIYGADPKRVDPPSAADPSAAAGADASAAGGGSQPLPHKLHLHCLPSDRAAFKKIRSDDIYRHFGGFGASYVEWLGLTACNVHFGDAFSARRAMMSKSFELPSLAEARATHAEEAQARGWTMANVNSAGEIIVDAMDEDTPPAADAAAAATPGKAKDMEADDDATAATDAATATATAPAAATAEEEAAAWSDLRELGWRLGAPLAKSKTDQWGTKGVRVRVLVRVATSGDVLHEKPAEPLLPPAARRRRNRNRGGGGGNWGQQQHEQMRVGSKRRNRDGDGDGDGDVMVEDFGDGGGGGGGGGSRKRRRKKRRGGSQDFQGGA